MKKKDQEAIAKLYTEGWESNSSLESLRDSGEPVKVLASSKTYKNFSIYFTGVVSGGQLPGQPFMVENEKGDRIGIDESSIKFERDSHGNIISMYI